MKILVGWDDEAQAELISLYLNVDVNEAVVTTEPAQVLREVSNGHVWDAVLINTRLPDIEGAYTLFQELRKAQPDVPVIGACSSQDVFRMARFMTGGMKSYIIRDDGADFVFLLQTTVEQVVASVQAERENKIAEKLREEIESVRKLQESIIPQQLSCPPGYAICARYEPSQMQVMGGRPVLMAGGDYYDVFSYDENNIVVLVGDASGHGMKACMSIMTMHTLVRMLRNDKYQDPSAFVREVNRQLCQQSVVCSEGGFITLLYGVLHLDRQEFQWTSAGHPIPLLHELEFDRVGAVASDECGGMPLGIDPDAEYDVQTTAIPPASRLLLYTDGLVDAFPERAEVHKGYGVPGVSNSLRSARSLTLSDTLDALFKDTHAFTGGTGRHDDTSAVLIERS